MKILLANDDGIEAEGLLAAVRAFSSIGDVYVVAPEGQRSSSSHHLTIFGRIRYEERQVPCAKKAYAIWGTPSDCVHLGLFHLVGEDVDLVVSGINAGPNISTDIIYSGTVGAAREAHIHGIPAIALSNASFTPRYYAPAADHALKIAKRYLADPDAASYYLNINVPDLPEEEIRGLAVCDEVGRVRYNDRIKEETEDGITYLRILNGVRETTSEHDGLNIDINALKQGYISVSALYNSHISEDHSRRLHEMFG